MIILISELFQAPLTGIYRVTGNAFANPEDAMAASKGDPEKAKKMLVLVQLRIY